MNSQAQSEYSSLKDTSLALVLWKPGFAENVERFVVPWDPSYGKAFGSSDVRVQAAYVPDPNIYVYY